MIERTIFEHERHNVLNIGEIDCNTRYAVHQLLPPFYFASCGLG